MRMPIYADEFAYSLVDEFLESKRTDAARLSVCRFHNGRISVHHLGRSDGAA